MRNNNSGEVYRDLDEAGYIRDVAAGASTTLSAAVLAGAATFSVVSAVGIIAGDLLRIDSNDKIEEVVVDSVAANVITPRDVIEFDHTAGMAVVEREKVNTGDVTDQGVAVQTTESSNTLNSSTKKGKILRLVSNAEHTFGWSVHNHSLENVAIAHGIPETRITGGTGGKPKRLVVSHKALSTLKNVSVYFIGTREDGKKVELQGWGADLSGNSTNTYNTGTGVPVQIQASVSAKVYLEF